MAELGDVREVGTNHFEVCVSIEEPGVQDPKTGTWSPIEIWEPLATHFARYRLLEIGRVTFPISVYDALLAEGWIPPGQMRSAGAARLDATL